MTTVPRSTPLSGRRKFWFRSAALLLSLLPLLATELLCRVSGWGAADLTVDPFVGFAAVRPLFRRTTDGAHYRTAPERLQYFREDQFAAGKPTDALRVFVFGGSTVQGHPFSIETSFPTFLRQSLETAQPNRTWEVINCGGVSYASYRLLPIVTECLDYEPDLFVFCSGQNEFLEDVSYSRQRQTAPLLSPLWSAAQSLQSFRAAVQLVQHLQNRRAVAAPPGPRSPATRPVLPTEVQTLLDQHGGLEHYHRNDQHAADVVSHYANNIRRLIELCRQNDVPLLIVQPPVNLSDCPPFKSEFSNTTTPQLRQQISAGLQAASRLSATDSNAAVLLAEHAANLDPRYALSWYQLGQLLLNTGRWDDARNAFQRAVDEDVCPLRMTSPLQRSLRQAVADTGAPFLDAQSLLSTGCRGQILGEQRLVDHVHPSFRGHEDIAVAIAEWMVQQGLLNPDQDGWQEFSRQRCRLAVQQLDDSYFLQGRRRLQVLKNWAAGRAMAPDQVEE